MAKDLRGIRGKSAIKAFLRAGGGRDLGKEIIQISKCLTE